MHEHFTVGKVAQLVGRCGLTAIAQVPQAIGLGQHAAALRRLEQHWARPMQTHQEVVGQRHAYCREAGPAGDEQVQERQRHRHAGAVHQHAVEQQVIELTRIRVAAVQRQSVAHRRRQFARRERQTVADAALPQGVGDVAQRRCHHRRFGHEGAHHLCQQRGAFEQVGRVAAPGAAEPQRREAAQTVADLERAQDTARAQPQPQRFRFGSSAQRLQRELAPAQQSLASCDDRRLATGAEQRNRRLDGARAGLARLWLGLGVFVGFAHRLQRRVPDPRALGEHTKRDRGCASKGEAQTRAEDPRISGPAPGAPHTILAIARRATPHPAMDPICMHPEEFRRHAHAVVDWLADYRARVADLPVQTAVRPGALLAALPSSPPEQPEGFAAVLADVERLVLPALSHWQHPGFYGYFPSNGDLASVLGDFLSTGLGVLGLAWQSAPALTELEDRCCDWLRQLFGLSPAWQGVIQDTASTTTLIALLCARERTTSHGQDRGGLQDGSAPLVVYTSSEAHSSVPKAALLAGFGRDFVRKIATDANRALDPRALAAAIAADRAAGLRPCAIVATAGTTSTTAFDPLAACAELAAAHGLWLHVDAAMAGAALLLPECRPRFAGIEAADSIVINAHKWLGVAFDCSLHFVRDPDHLVRVLSTNPSYLRTAVDNQVKNYRDWGIPLGRRFRALKVWSLLRTHGAERLRQRLRRDLELAQWLGAQVAATPPWRLLAPVTLQTVCLRHEPPGLGSDALDAHTLRWLERVHRTGRAWLTPAQLDGRWFVRVSIGALSTEPRHVAELWQLLQEAVA